MNDEIGRDPYAVDTAVASSNHPTIRESDSPTLGIFGDTGIGTFTGNAIQTPSCKEPRYSTETMCKCIEIG